MFSLLKKWGLVKDPSATAPRGAPTIHPRYPADPNGIVSTQEPSPGIREVWHQLSPGVEIALHAAAILIFVAILIALAWSVSGLGRILSQSPEFSLFLGLVTAATFAFHSIAMAAAGNHASKLINTLCVATWLVLAVMLAVLYTAALQTGLHDRSSIDEIQSALRHAGATGVNTEMLLIGQFAYDALIGLVITTFSLGVWGPLAIGRAVKDLSNPNLSDIFKKIGYMVVMVMAVVGSFFGMFLFGQAMGNDLFRSIGMALVADITFLTALQRSYEPNKRIFLVLAIGAIVYSMTAGMLYGDYLAYSHGGLDVEAGRAGILSSSFGSLIYRLFNMSGPAFALAWGIFEVITQERSTKPKPAGAEVIDGNYRTRSRKVADSILGFRRGWLEIQSAINDALDGTARADARPDPALLNKDADAPQPSLSQPTPSADGTGEPANNNGTQTINGANDPK